MLETLIYAYLAHQHPNSNACDCFVDTFGRVDLFSEVETSELAEIDESLEEIKDAKVLQKHAISELSEYHKALKLELKERENDYF